MSNSTEGDDVAEKRQRVSRACDLCRRKKIKCDGLAPICSNCQAFSLACSYKDTTKKRGPPKGYIEAIENRLHKLEGLLNEVIQEDDPRSKALLAELNSPLETTTGEQIKSRPVRRKQHSKHHSTNSQDSSQRTPDTSNEHNQRQLPSPKSSVLSQPYLVSSPTLSSSGLADSPSSPDSINDGTGQLSMDESGQVRYLGKSSGYYLLQKSRTYQNGAFHFSGWGHKPSTSHKTPLLDPLELPPKDLSKHLIDIYFKYFYPCMPLFHKKFLVPETTPEEPVSPLLLNAIYALASRMSPDERVRADPASPDTAGEIFFERARCLLDDYYDIPKISTVQALLLLASHQQGVTKPARSWLYSGMAFRMAQDLGLHRNCEHWNISREERERRKRVFWCCFITDRLTSAIYGRSSNFEERDIDVPFPQEDDDEPVQEDSESSRPPVRILDILTQMIKICDILGHVLKNIYYAKARHHGLPQHIDHILLTLNRQLTTWFGSLPPSLQYKPPNTQIGETGPDPPLPVCQLHLVYYTTVILLHRPFIPGPTQTVSPMSLPSYKICISASNTILDIVNIMLVEKHLPYVSNFTVYYVFTAGIIFINLASSSDTESAFDAKVNINKIMRALDEIELTWTNATRSSNIIGELAGLRDINLECGEVGPQPAKTLSLPPASIAVPNSPEISMYDHRRRQSRNFEDNKIERSNFTESQWSSQLSNSQMASQKMPDHLMASHGLNYMPLESEYKYPFMVSPTASSGPKGNVPTRSISLHDSNQYSTHANNGFMDAQTTDPFAAPGTVLGPTQRQFDPLGTAFWGVPSSLDTEEWNNYLGAQSVPNQNYGDHGNNNNGPSTNQQLVVLQDQPLISSHEFSPTQSIVSQDNHNRQQLRQDSSKNPPHNDRGVEMFSGMSMSMMPDSPSRSVLLGYMGNNRIGQSGSDNDNSLKQTYSSRMNEPEPAELMYW
ncbi:fungal-specific transcription factor domain-containing protein [Phycomyces nitens]|nr:fungal-specific transcription factor domain-containing protein [Phycomyces nitens]